MAESADSLFRRGMISPRQAAKLAAQRGTRTNPAFGAGEEPFAGRQGRRDQGGRSDRGETAVAGSAHISNRRAGDMGTPARAGGKPSKGGQAPMGGRAPHVAEIDEGERQRPEFPRGAGRTSGRAQPAFVPAGARALAAKGPRGQSNAGSYGTPPRARGGNPRSSGPQYGGPNSRANG